MKPLTNEEKESVFDNIVKSIAYLHNPAPGEFTLQQLLDALKAMGYEASLGKVRYRISKLTDAGLLSVRKIITNDTQTNVYMPLENTSYEELLDVLLE